MPNPFSRLKEYLRHVRTSSWHYRLAKEVWGERRIRRSKACTYYWFQVPLAMLATVVVFAIVTVIWTISLFCGFVPTEFQSHHAERQGIKGDWAYDYKHLPNGTRFFIAPWEMVLIGLVVWTLWTFLQTDPETIGWVRMTIGGLLLLIAFITIIVKSRSKIATAWNHVCPPLVVEPDQRQNA